MAGGDDQAQGAGRVQQDVCNEIVNRLIANDLVVVQNQNKVLFDGRQIIEQSARNRAGGWQGRPAHDSERVVDHREQRPQSR